MLSESKTEMPAGLNVCIWSLEIILKVICDLTETVPKYDDCVKNIKDGEQDKQLDEKRVDEPWSGECCQSYEMHQETNWAQDNLWKSGYI